MNCKIPFFDPFKKRVYEYKYMNIKRKKEIDTKISEKVETDIKIFLTNQYCTDLLSQEI